MNAYPMIERCFRHQQGHPLWPWEAVSQQRPPEMDTPRGVFVVAEERGAMVTVPLAWEVPVA